VHNAAQHGAQVTGHSTRHTTTCRSTTTRAERGTPPRSSAAICLVVVTWLATVRNLSARLVTAVARTISLGTGLTCRRDLGNQDQPPQTSTRRVTVRYWLCAHYRAHRLYTGVLRLTWNGDGGQQAPQPAGRRPSTRTTPSPDLCGPRRAPSDVDGAAGEFECLSGKSLINTTSDFSPRASLIWQNRRPDDARPYAEHPRAVITKSPDHSMRAREGCGSTDGDRRTWVVAADDGPAGRSRRVCRTAPPAWRSTRSAAGVLSSSQS